MNTSAHISLILLSVLALSTNQCFADQTTEANLAYSMHNYSKAFSLYQELAKSGSANAEYFISEMYRDGNGVSQDNEEAVRWLRLSAIHGCTKAMASYGAVNADGKLIPQNLDEALIWIRKAAINGEPTAQLNLGWAYMSDYLKLPPNYALAMEWNLKAANNGEGEAASNVGLLYENGWGVPVSYSEAIKWYHKALDQEPTSWQSWYRLAGIYENGLGVEKDLEYAAELYSLVVLSGDEEFLSSANKRLLYVQDLIQLQKGDEIKYPQELPPRDGRSDLEHG